MVTHLGVYKLTVRVSVTCHLLGSVMILLNNGMAQNPSITTQEYVLTQVNRLTQLQRGQASGLG